eukprot:754354-Prymnesium_polylepis.2
MSFEFCALSASISGVKPNLSFWLMSAPAASASSTAVGFRSSNRTALIRSLSVGLAYLVMFEASRHSGVSMGLPSESSGYG